MTDPSPDCGYTDAEEALEAKERMFNDSALERLVASGRQYQDEHGRYIAPLAQLLLKARSRVTEQTRRTDQAFEEIARLREFGEHYSGAAQDAWDRIGVLEKALRGIVNCLGPTTVACKDCCRGCSAEMYEALRLAEGALPAGSASPGGAET